MCWRIRACGVARVKAALRYGGGRSATRGRAPGARCAALRRRDDDDADLELSAARDEFERLGAKPDLAAVEAELRELEERRASRVQVQMTFLFTDIVGSTKLAEALGNQAWERLLRWHDEMLRAEVARRGGRIVHSTGTGSSRFDRRPGAPECDRDPSGAHVSRRDQRVRTAVPIGCSPRRHPRGEDFSGSASTSGPGRGAASGGEILASRGPDEAGGSRRSMPLGLSPRVVHTGACASSS